MKKVLIVLCCCVSFAYAADEKQPVQTTPTKNSDNEKNSTSKNTEQLPDKALLLFLSEFSDAQDEWVDPEIFNQPFAETENEDHPDHR